jgi:membrane associated rhomboid family serine protease
VNEQFIVAPPQRPRATFAILALNVAVYFISEWFAWHRSAPVEEWFALSQRGLGHGWLWQVITFQFLHAPLAHPPGWQTIHHLDIPWHLILNCWGIFVFGPPVEFTLGRKKFVLLYLLSGSAGGLLQILAGALSHHFAGPVVGASAGLFGLIAAFTTLYPATPMTVLLLFVIPVRMSANTMLTVATAITVGGLVVAGLWPNLGINRIAHGAHLGGLICGLIFLRWQMRFLFRK